VNNSLRKNAVCNLAWFENPQTRPSTMERAFVVLTLLFLTGGFIPLFQRERGLSFDPVQGNPFYQAVFAAIYLITYLLVLVQWRAALLMLLKEKAVLLLAGIALLSVVWSDAPEVTLRQAMALLGTTLFAVYFTLRYSLRQQLQLLAWTLGICAVFSLVFGLLIPDFGMPSGIHTAGWHGVFAHRNTLGRMMALSALLFALLAMSARRHRWILWATLIVSSVLVLLSRSASAWVVLASIALLLVVSNVLRWPHATAIPAALFVLLAGGVAVSSIFMNLETVLGAVGRDTTLTGRTQLWGYVLDKIAERPWLGFGYGGFWLGWDASSAYVWAKTNWRPSFAHNGFLDLTLQIGLLGLVAFLVGLARGLLRAAALIRSETCREAFWPLLYILIFTIQYNLAESSILARNNIFWVLYVAGVLGVQTVRPNRPKAQAHFSLS